MASAAITCPERSRTPRGDREQAGLELLDARRVAALAHCRELALRGPRGSTIVAGVAASSVAGGRRDAGGEEDLAERGACSTSCRPTQFVVPRM